MRESRKAQQNQARASEASHTFILLSSSKYETLDSQTKTRSTEPSRVSKTVRPCTRFDSSVHDQFPRDGPSACISRTKRVFSETPLTPTAWSPAEQLLDIEEDSSGDLWREMRNQVRYSYKEDVSRL